MVDPSKWVPKLSIMIRHHKIYEEQKSTSL